MRKHFLILMLMALLPMASFATNYSVRVYGAVSELPYGTAKPAAVNASMVNFVTDADITGVTADLVNLLSFTSEYEAGTGVGNVTFTLSEKTPGAYVVDGASNKYFISIENASGTFKVVKETTVANIIVPNVPVLTDADPEALVYAGPTTPISLLKAGNLGSGKINDFEDVALEYAVSKNGGAVGEYSETGYQVIGAGEYTVYYRVAATDNNVANDGVALTGTVTITKGTPEITLPTLGTDVVYDGNTHAVATVNGSATLDAAVTYKLVKFNPATSSWDNVATATDATTLTATLAGRYKIKAKVDETDDLNAVPNQLTEDEFVIGQKDLTVTTNDVTTWYTGAAPAFNGVEYAGFADGEDEGDIDVAALDYDILDEHNTYSAGSYRIQAKGIVAPNYNLIYVPGTLTINKAKVKVVLKDKTATYGTDASKLKTWSNIAVANVGDHISKFQVQNGEETYGDVAVGNYATYLKVTADIIDGLTLSRTGNDDVTTVGNEYVISATGAQSANANYQIIEYTPAKFTINAADIIVAALAKTKVYGEIDPALDYTVTLGGAPLELTAEQKQNIQIARVNGEEVGSYAITFGTSPATIDGYAVTYNPSTFTITKRPMTITAKDQRLYTGMTLDDLSKTAADYVIGGEGLATGDEDKVELTWAFDFTANGNVTLDTEDKLKITSANNVENVNDGINIELKAGDKTTYLLANYDITVVDGDLAVVNAALALILNPNEADMVAKINAAATADVPVYICFEDQEPAAAAKTLKAGQWNTLVLPFNTTVAEVSAALGYAVVDVLDESNDNPDAIKLKLAFGTLPAHKPFLVQPAADIKLSNVNYWNQVGNEKKVVTVPASPEMEDGGNHALVGTYANYKVMPTATNEYFYSNTEKQFVNSSREGGTTITVFGAYLVDRNANAPAHNLTIYVEEPDGSTTAISTINADGVAVPAEGWYTLNGVKLQGVPTEKGIYIHNGKKLVVK